MTYAQAVESFKRQFLMDALKAAGWNVTKMARQIGINRQYAHRLMVQLRVPRPVRHHAAHRGNAEWRAGA